MQELNYYNDSEEISLNGNDYTLEVNISGYYSFDRGDGHNTPPEETIEGVDVNIVKAYLFAEDGQLDEVMDEKTLKELADQLDAEELLKEEL